MQSLYNELGVSKKVIDDAKGNKASKGFAKFKDTAPPIPNYNEMVDWLELPTAKFEFKYVLDNWLVLLTIFIPGSLFLFKNAVVNNN